MTAKWRWDHQRLKLVEDMQKIKIKIFVWFTVCSGLNFPGFFSVGNCLTTKWRDAIIIWQKVGEDCIEDHNQYCCMVYSVCWLKFPGLQCWELWDHKMKRCNNHHMAESGRRLYRRSKSTLLHGLQCVLPKPKIFLVYSVGNCLTAKWRCDH